MSIRFLRLARVLTGMVILSLYTLVVLVLSTASTGKVLFRSVQPKNINYHSFDPYTLQIREGPISWSKVGWPRSAVIEVARVPASYGNSISLEITGGQECTGADWQPDGVQVSFSSGHRFFIPKGAFIGGR